PVRRSARQRAGRALAGLRLRAVSARAPATKRRGPLALDRRRRLVRRAGLGRPRRRHGGARAPRTARRRHRLRRDRRAVAVRPAGSRLQAPAHPAQRSIDRGRDQLGSIRLFVVLSIGAPPPRRRACSDTAPVIAAWMVAGTLLATAVSGWVPQRALALTFATIVYAGATQILLGRKPSAERTLPATPALLAIGALIGVVCGLVSAGGAFMTVPFMLFCGVA